MSNNLELFREKFGLTAKQLSILLNVTVHTYKAMEQNKVSLSPEIIIMLSKIYEVPTHFLFEDMNVNISKINLASEQFVGLDEDCKFSKAFKNLTGECIGKSMYRQIRIAKAQISDNINTPL